MNINDPKDVLGSTGLLSKQCQQIWELSKELDFTQEYQQVQNIVLCGMGGSAYGGYVVNALFKDQLKVAFYSNNDFQLPEFAGSNTLIILSSYSGSTEEVLSCTEDAQQRGCKITGLTAGGKLGQFLTGQNLPALIFEPKFNPSGQPRLGTGYMVLGTVGMLNKLGLIDIVDEEVTQAIKELEENQESIRRQAEELAKKIQGLIPIIFASEFLAGNAHILRNQFNETAKSFAAFSLLPELNHHLMEGLKNPPDKKLFALFLNSDSFSDKLKRRVELTKDVVGKNGALLAEYQAQGSSKLSQVLNVLSFGGYLSVNLAFLYGQDPSLIPWVDYFKEKLTK